MRVSHLVGILVAIALIVFYTLVSVFPKNVSFLPVILGLSILDGYLWFSIQNRILGLKRIPRYTLLGLYWLPLMVLISSLISGWAVPFLEWGILLRTYVPGFIVTSYFCKAVPIIFLLLSDLERFIRFSFSYFRKGTPSPYSSFIRKKWLLITGWVTGGLLFLFMIVGMAWWNYDFRIKKVDICLPELPESFDNLRIVQISDLHLGSWGAPGKLVKAVEMVNNLEPDLIFFTGDIANYTTDDVLPFESILRELKSKNGIYSILGNHDYGDYVHWDSPEEKEADLMALQYFYKRLGWKLLLNEHDFMIRGKDTIVILGVHNWGKTKRFQKLGDVGKAESGIKNQNIQFLLTHDPSSWAVLVNNKFNDIDITFSGHTHGFQFGIDLGGWKWSPAQYFYPQWAGLYYYLVPGSHPQYLYVNCGLGSLGYPGRIGILPEITLFRITND